MQAAPTASEVAQVVVAIVKFGESVVLKRVSGRPPLLVRVTVCDGEASETPVLGKLTAKGESETPGGATPVPLRYMVCERNWSVRVRIAER